MKGSLLLLLITLVQVKSNGGVLKLKIPKFLWQKLPSLCATKIFRNLNEEKKIMLYIVILGLIVVPSHFRNLFHNQTIFFSVLNLRKLLLLIISFSKNTAQNSTFDLTVTFQMIGKRWFWFGWAAEGTKIEAQYFQVSWWIFWTHTGASGSGTSL